MGFAMVGDPGMFGGVESSLFGVSGLIDLWGKIFWYLLWGIVFTCTPRSTYVVMAFIPFFVGISIWV